MRFFLLAPYDFGASSKIIKNGVIFSVKYPFNGFFSEQIPFGRVVRQGRPLSSFLALYGRHHYHNKAKQILQGSYQRISRI